MSRAKQLGRKLKAVRSIRQKSLKTVAGDADMSAAYLQKLERGEVKSPSPHKLQKLAKALDVPYLELMKLAGYVVPRTKGSPDAGVSLLATALNSEELTEDELDALARYLNWYRHERDSVRDG